MSVFKKVQFMLTLAKSLLFLLVGKDADLRGKCRPQYLLLRVSAAQKFVPNAELPTRDLDNDISIDK